MKKARKVTDCGSESPVAIYTLEGVATLLDVSTRTIQRYVASGQMPEPIRLKKNLWWLVADIKSWLEAGCPSAAKWRQLRGT